MTHEDVCSNPECRLPIRSDGHDPARPPVCSACGVEFTPPSSPVGDAPTPLALLLARSADEIPPGEIFDGRYRIEALAGRGGMGSVYRAHEIALDRPVALKLPILQGNSTADALARFHREARAIAAIRHPSICTIHYYGDWGGVPYIVMEYLEGESLADRIRRGPLESREAAGVAHPIALALDHAHQIGLIHRDLKPSNVQLDPRRGPVVLDFGLVRRLEVGEASFQTRPNALVGTLPYMAPEQVDTDAGPAGPAADVYALGVILYESLSGRRPFPFKDARALIHAITSKEAPTLAGIRPDVDPRLAAVCRYAMAKRPEERFGSMAEMADALAAVLKQPPLATSIRGRWRIVLRIAAATAILAIAVVALWNWGANPVDPLVAESKGSADVKPQTPPPPTQEVDGGQSPKVPATDTDRDLSTIIPTPTDPPMDEAQPRSSVDAQVQTGESTQASAETGGVTEVEPNDSVGKKPNSQLLVEPPLLAEWPSPMIKIEMLLVKKGDFMMGVPPVEKGFPDDPLPHMVTIKRPFYLAKFELTVAQLDRIAGRQAAVNRASDFPVVVTFLEAIEICNKLSEIEGLTPFYSVKGTSVDIAAPHGGGFRLATSEEWEYACRAGSTTAYSFGNMRNSLEDYAWFASKDEVPRQVGQGLPNPWGFFDMHGNLREWCWGPDPTTGKQPTRGGSFLGRPNDLRSGTVVMDSISERFKDTGLRLARDAVPMP